MEIPVRWAAVSIFILILSEFVRLRMFFSSKKTVQNRSTLKLTKPKMGSAVNKFFLKNEYVYINIYKYFSKMNYKNHTVYPQYILSIIF